MGISKYLKIGFQQSVLSSVRQDYCCCLNCLRGGVRRSRRRVFQDIGTPGQDLEVRMILVYSRDLNIFRS